MSFIYLSKSTTENKNICKVGKTTRDPEKRAKSVVDATTHFDNQDKLMEISTNLKSAMKGLDISEIPEDQMLQNRGW